MDFRLAKAFVWKGPHLRVTIGDGSGSELTDDEVAPLMRSLVKFLRQSGTNGPVCIEVFDASGRGLGDLACVAFSRNLARGSALFCLISSLRVLKLYKNRIGDGGAIALAAWLSTSAPGLEELHLSHNNISTTGAVAFIRGAAESGRYPMVRSHAGGKPTGLWCRLEQNNIDPDQAMKEIEAGKEGLHIQHWEMEWKPGAGKRPVASVMDWQGNEVVTLAWFLLQQHRGRTYSDGENGDEVAEAWWASSQWSKPDVSGKLAWKNSEEDVEEEEAEDVEDEANEQDDAEEEEESTDGCAWSKWIDSSAGTWKTAGPSAGAAWDGATEVKEGGKSWPKGSWVKVAGKSAAEKGEGTDVAQAPGKGKGKGTSVGEAGKGKSVGEAGRGTKGAQAHGKGKGTEGAQARGKGGASAGPSQGTEAAQPPKPAKAPVEKTDGSAAAPPKQEELATWREKRGATAAGSGAILPGRLAIVALGLMKTSRCPATSQKVAVDTLDQGEFHSTENEIPSTVSFSTRGAFPPGNCFEDPPPELAPSGRYSQLHDEPLALTTPGEPLGLTKLESPSGLTRPDEPPGLTKPEVVPQSPPNEEPQQPSTESTTAAEEPQSQTKARSADKEAPAAEPELGQSLDADTAIVFTRRLPERAKFSEPPAVSLNGRDQVILKTPALSDVPVTGSRVHGPGVSKPETPVQAPDAPPELSGSRWLSGSSADYRRPSSSDASAQTRPKPAPILREDVLKAVFVLRRYFRQAEAEGWFGTWDEIAWKSTPWTAADEPLRHSALNEAAKPFLSRYTNPAGMCTFATAPVSVVDASFGGAQAYQKALVPMPAPPIFPAADNFGDASGRYYGAAGRGAYQRSARELW